MPTFENYWDRLVSANPPLADLAKVTLTTEQLKTRIRLAYEQGRVDGLKQLDDGLNGKMRGLFNGLGF